MRIGLEDGILIVMDLMNNFKYFKVSYIICLIITRL